MERQCPEHSFTNYVGVPSVEEAAAKVEKLGGKICMEKTAVPEMGYFVVCQDTENNTFALWEAERKGEIVVLKTDRSFVVTSKTERKPKNMKTETTTGEYMLLFRGPHWDRGYSGRTATGHGQSHGVV